MNPSDSWTKVFPAPRIPDVLRYVVGTWEKLRATYPTEVCFRFAEPTLTDSLCEALQDTERRFACSMDCDFVAEVWQLQRQTNAKVLRIARADILVLLGSPGLPKLILEFKKLDGSARARNAYCFDGISRFLQGKYASQHSHGVMCGFTPKDLNVEVSAISEYISKKEYREKLNCIVNSQGEYVTLPSAVAPGLACFDSTHERLPAHGDSITMLHLVLACPIST